MFSNAGQPHSNPESAKALRIVSAFGGLGPRSRIAAVAISVHTRKSGRSHIPCLLLLAALVGATQSRAQVAPFRDITTKYDYDTFGNISQITRSTGDGYTDARSFTYRYEPASWLVAMPTQVLASSVTPSNQSTTRTTQIIPDSLTGALTSQTTEPNGDETTYELTSYDLDPHGVLTRVASQDKAGQQIRTLSFRYDSEELYPTNLTNTLGYTEAFAVHPAFGAIAAHRDANGVFERFQFDGFGRLKYVAAPDGDNVSFAYQAAPFFEIESQYASGRLTRTNYDAFLNEVEHDSTAFDGRLLAQITKYNGQNLIAEEDGPCFKGAANCAGTGSERFTYDELGRSIGVLHADGSNRTNLYRGLTIEGFDEVQNEHYVVRDQAGQVTRSAAVVDDGREVATTFGYEPFGILQTITDAYGNVVRSTHDVRGRQVALKDPDAGNHSYQWTTFDDLGQEQDGNGSTTFLWDALGRIQSIRDKDGTATFCWDTAPNGIGKLGYARSTDAIHTAFAYDPQSRVRKVTWTLGGRNYSLGTTYDSIGRIDKLLYPSIGRAAFSVQQKYNSFGFLSQVVNTQQSSLYWQADSQNERGESTKEEFGNGLATERSYDIRGRLTGVATTGRGAIQQVFSYNYFPNGSLECRANQLPSPTVMEHFGYDRLDRMIDWSAGTGANVSHPCEEEEPAKLLDQAFGYDDVGNLKRRSTTFGTGPNLIYQYGQNEAGPHAVTQINLDSYGYDTVGNQISAPTRTVQYKTFNLPARLRENGRTTSFKYDVSHERVLKHGTRGDSTTYIAGLYELRRRRLGSTEVFYVPAAGRLVAQVERTRKSSLQRTLFFHGDNLGSIRTVTDRSGAVVEQVAYEPLGQQVNPSNPGIVVSPKSSVTVGFTGQIGDTGLGLINMKGRIYEPEIGKFLTPDPLIQDPLRSESLNRYSYAWNNPLKWVDSTGFQDEAPPDVGSSSDSSDVSGCGPGCTQWNPQEGETINVKVAEVSAAARSATADDDGPLSPPPLVNAPAPGPYSCCAAASDPSEWAPLPPQPPYGINFPPPGFERIRANFPFVDAASISADTPNRDPNVGTGLEKTYVPIQAGGAVTAAIAAGTSGTVLRGSIWVYSKAPWLLNSLLAIGNSFTIGGTGGSASQEEVVLSNRAAGEIIGWGQGQGQAGVEMTRRLTQNLTAEAVQEMISKGLNQATVKELLLQYSDALAQGGAKVTGNFQLQPRHELMQRIMGLWPH